MSAKVIYFQRVGVELAAKFLELPASIRIPNSKVRNEIVSYILQLTNSNFFMSWHIEKPIPAPIQGG